MAVHNAAGIAHFHARQDEHKYAKLLDEAFDVVTGTSAEDFSWWILQPKDHVRARFDLTRELLCIWYPDGEKVDARLFARIRTVLQLPECRDRLDQVLVVLIHDAPDVETAEFVKGHKDWIIVPLPRRGLSNSQRGNMYIRSRIAGTAGQRNLFSWSSPIKRDAYFFGRDDLVNKLYQRATQDGENSGVFGLRKTGKTSVLYAVQRRASGTSSVFVYLDCQTPGVHAQRWWELLGEIAERWAQQYADCGLGLRPTLPTKWTEREAPKKFSEFCRHMLNTRGCQALTFMLDEVEYVTPEVCSRFGRHWDEDALPFWQTVRGVGQETHGRVTFLMAGVNPLIATATLLAGHPNPVFQLAAPYYLEPLSRDQVRHMVRTIGKYSGVSFDEDAYEHLRGTYGGHPFLIRQACAVVWAEKDTADASTRPGISAADFVTSAARVRSRLHEPVKDILLSLAWFYPEEYQLLLILAEGDSGFVLDYIKSETNRMTQFADLGLIDLSSGAFLAEDVRHFLSTEGALYRDQIAPFLRSEIPADLLPDVPDLSLLSELQTLQAQLEVRLRRTVILVLGFANEFKPSRIADAMVKGLAKNSDYKEPRSLFHGRTPRDVVNDLYLYDLGNIVVANWGHFSSVFGQKVRVFETNIETANVSRRGPGHTRPVTPEEGAAYRSAHDWLLLCLKRADDALQV